MPGPFLEVGSYCGKSAIYIGGAAKAQGRDFFALDHHRGSEENQAGWQHHEPDLVDPSIGKMDTLPIFRRTIHDAGLEGTVVALVGDSPTVGSIWQIPLALLFIDGGHGSEPAHRELRDVGTERRGGWHAADSRRVSPILLTVADHRSRSTAERWSRELFARLPSPGSLRRLERIADGI